MSVDSYEIKSPFSVRRRGGLPASSRNLNENLPFVMKESKMTIGEVITPGIDDSFMMYSDMNDSVINVFEFGILILYGTIG